MLCYLLLVYIPLTTHFTVPVIGQASPCASGFFGQYCEFKCHCMHSTTCGRDGECSFNEPCAAGYFGPGCQYMDVVQSNAMPSVPLFLRDGNDSTCNPDRQSTTAEVSLQHPTPMTFIRIYGIRSSNLFKFAMVINDVMDCRTQRKFLITISAVDITCDEDIPVSKLRFDGAMAGSLCGIYISGGRNIAMKKHANQTSCFGPDPNFCMAPNAVDGNISTCSHTTSEASQRAKWFLTLSRQYRLYTLRLYNRDTLQERLNNFTFEAFDSNRAMVLHYQDNDTALRGIIDANIYSAQLVEYVMITLSDLLQGTDRALSLCEVEIYGDSMCTNGTYGLDCNQTCSCYDKTFACNPFSGMCAPGCRSGYYGYRCTNLCGENCLSGNCEFLSGRCIQCNPGYLGPFCTQECKSGFYGQECKGICSERCSQACNVTNGECPCRWPFNGTMCTECAVGYYGADCSLLCPDDCTDNMCDPATGNCMSCRGHHAGDRCESCEHGFYGARCDSVCSTNCVNGTCDQVTGACFSCKKGFHGSLCSEVSQVKVEEGRPTWVLLIPLFLLLIVFVFLIRRDDAGVVEEM